MTGAAWELLSPEAQNEMIAQWSGGVYKPCECGMRNCDHGMVWHWAAAGGQMTSDVPRYTTSLDLMHEVLQYHMGKDPFFLSVFVCSLGFVVCGSDSNRNDWRCHMEDLVNADSHQRAEALILTLTRAKTGKQPT